GRDFSGTGPRAPGVHPDGLGLPPREVPDPAARLGGVGEHAQQGRGSLPRFWHPLLDRREGEEIEVLARFQGGELLLNKVLDKGGLMVEVATRRISEHREW